MPQYCNEMGSLWKYGALLFPCPSMILQAAPNPFSSKISGLDFKLRSSQYEF